LGRDPFRKEAEDSGSGTVTMTMTVCPVQRARVLSATATVLGRKGRWRASHTREKALDPVKAAPIVVVNSSCRQW
jgi:hypothetical protein